MTDDIEQEECEAATAWVRKAAITAVTERIAELQRGDDADTPERLEVLQRLLVQLEKGRANEKYQNGRRARGADDRGAGDGAVRGRRLCARAGSLRDTGT